MALIRESVRGLMIDERTKSPIVVLQENDGERILPIWIGDCDECLDALGHSQRCKRVQLCISHCCLVQTCALKPDLAHLSAVMVLKDDSLSIGVTNVTMRGD